MENVWYAAHDVFKHATKFVVNQSSPLPPAYAEYEEGIQNLRELIKEKTGEV